MVDVDPGERAHGVGTADVRERLLGHHDDVGEPEEQRRTRDARARRPSAPSGRRPTRWRAPGRRSPTRAATRRLRRRRRPTTRSCRRSGRPRSIAWRTRARAIASPRAARSRRRACRPRSVNSTTVRPSISPSAAAAVSLRRAARGRGRRAVVTRWASAPARRCGHRTRTSSRSTGFAPISRSVPRTTSSAMSSPSCSRFAVGGTTPSRIESSEIDGLGRARAADHVAEHALARR